MEGILNSKKHMLQPEKWIENYSEALGNFAVSRMNSNEEASDIVQETFFTALKAKDSFRGEASEKTWLTSILKRKIIDHYRKAVRKKPHYSIHEAGEESFVSSGKRKGAWNEEYAPGNWDFTFSDNEIEQKELNRMIMASIESLPDNAAKVFKMKYIDGMATEDICQELNLTTSNVWVLLHRSRNKVRQYLEKNWFMK
ncbi:sigma-70 family RNA polymerase sigma factor [Aureibacter tunicatorum]|uniref:RNA polymerase sigma-70 factor (ECF subfamily) n=1 Tax=Aureibacter tunicatorum TaxID=866807 RepID=A0AAE3XHI7_9BACT|nr:sigma-70 family RNA polymerase sigma factor [Aureibacter tunicatorum]MDR6237801.1 RNA polymerase sigma-70 factor (ECF subfamily) [Aureibacter tunicatorum]BDD02836.1 RNA polymerase sigma24 factor [Aureibacter tunicatorum]